MGYNSGGTCFIKGISVVLNQESKDFKDEQDLVNP